MAKTEEGLAAVRFIQDHLVAVVIKPGLVAFWLSSPQQSEKCRAFFDGNRYKAGVKQLREEFEVGRNL
jgi:hypothetical protein